MAESLLDQAFLSRLEYLYVVTRELFTGHISAERLSKKFGVGVEFADYRSYSAGDDFRYIDWSAYARRGELLYKLFTEEQAAQIYCVVDASLSMSVGEPQKLHFAKKVAAALGYIGLANLDPVTVVSFDDVLRDESRMFSGRGQLRHMLSYLEALQPRGGTSMGGAIRQFVQQFHGGGLVILLSDFLDRPGYEEAVRLLHYHRFDLLVVQINGRDELEPPLSADVELIDSENGERRTLQMSPDIIRRYQAAVEEHYDELKRLCKVMRRGYVAVTTDLPFENVIFDVFRRGGFVK